VICFCNTLDGGDNVAWHWITQLVIQEQAVVAINYEEIVIVREHDPVVAFSVSCDFSIRSIVLQNALNRRDSNVVSVVERLNVFRGYVLIAKNPHSLISIDRNINFVGDSIAANDGREVSSSVPSTA